jgi:DNA mismatch repair protein MutL
MNISLLPDDVINQIAAGEVIENPASVVKELVDNAIDAKAGHIAIEIQAGGQQLIKVEDDGCGMSQRDVEMCLLRHATSKLQKLDDLNSLQTMGFRGEALAAIASISKMEIRTSDGVEGTRLVADAGRLDMIEACARNRGTTIEVRSLFFNTPARRKFQKSPQANTSQIVRMVQSLALAEGSIAFRLCSQGQVLLEVPSSDWKKRIEAILGSELCSHGIWFEHEGLSGFLGPAEEARATRINQHYFINRRPIFSPMLSKAAKEGYGTRLAEGSHPSLALYLERSPDEFDVNVHPQKREVRFHDEGKLFCFVRESIQRAFLPCSLPSFFQNIHFEPNAALQPNDPWEEASCCVRSSKAAEAVNGQSVLWNDAPEGKALAVVGSFLLAERMGGVFVIDLREAHERQAMDSRAVQTLLFPIHLSLSNEEAPRMGELITRILDLGVEARAIGPKQLHLDAIPEWLNEADAAGFFHAMKEDLWSNLPIQETIRRFCRSSKKCFSIEEALLLWKKGAVCEVRLESADLERVIARKCQ